MQKKFLATAQLSHRKLSRGQRRYGVEAGDSREEMGGSVPGLVGEQQVGRGSEGEEQEKGQDGPNIMLDSVPAWREGRNGTLLLLSAQTCAASKGSKLFV